MERFVGTTKNMGCCVLLKRHEASWWWNNEVDVVIQEKIKLFRVWKKGGDEEEYLVVKCRARMEVYKAKKLVQDSLSDVINNTDSGGRYEMRMVRWMCDVTLKDRKSNVE